MQMLEPYKEERRRQERKAGMIGIILAFVAHASLLAVGVTTGLKYLYPPTPEPENLLPDAELTNAKQWLTRKGYSLAPGEGRGGANALVYERTNPKDYPLPGIGLKLPPGSYEFGGWVYCERNGSNEVGAAICMEMSENGKHIGGSYRAQRTGPADWRKVSSVLIVPENRKNVRLWSLAWRDL